MTLPADPGSFERPVVLVADDEPMLRRIVALTLRREGFDVLEAGDGSEGLMLLETGRPIDLLLTDVKMPGLNGYQLAEASLSLRPGMPVMLMTGFADEDVPEVVSRASIPTIRKPFDFARLGATIRETIGRRQGGNPIDPVPLPG
ncbi:MAG TPA: response regulator [Thermoanaerobaculia bacterium]